MAVRPHDLGEGPFAALASSLLLARLDARERERFLALTDIVEVAGRTRVHGDGDAGKHLYLLARGEATLRRAESPLRRLGPGDHFGELAVLGGRHRGEIVTADVPSTLVRLSAA